MGRTTSLRADPEGQLARIGTSVVAGLVAGLLVVTFMFSFSAVIMTGELEVFVPRLTGHLLVGGVILALVVGLRSQFRGAVALPQDNPTAVLAGIVLSILAGSHASMSPESMFATVIALIALSTAAGGVMLWMIGRFRLAQIGSYVPYPVVAGFPRCHGLAPLQEIVFRHVGRSFDIGSLGDLGPVAELWIVGGSFGVALWLLEWRFTNPFVMPAAIVLAIVGFYATLAVSGVSRSEAIAEGWLLPPFGGGTLLEGIDLGGIQWSIVSAEAGGLVTVLVIVAISVLLNLTALSSSLRADVDFDRELRLLGLATWRLERRQPDRIPQRESLHPRAQDESRQPPRRSRGGGRLLRSSHAGR